MSDLVFNIYKKSGVTPLECINILKKEKPELKFLPMTYAGRLDPLAEGVLLILAGDECYQKEKYLNLPKEYEVEVLFGFATDTYDVMGKVTKAMSIPDMKEASMSGMDIAQKNILKYFIGRFKQSYPPYSSRTVKGKPLFMWTREGKLDEIEIPSHDVFVENIEIIGQSEILGIDLLQKIKEDISKVKGDFRQREIVSLWEAELKNKDEEIYPVIKLRISCGSGVYVRSIANEIGEKLGIGALALKIVRTKVGEYYIN